MGRSDTSSAGRGPEHSDQDHPAEEGLSPGNQFLNFSFKNLELLGERNIEMAGRSGLQALRAKFGANDPYEEGPPERGRKGVERS